MGKNLKKALALFFTVIMLVSVVPVNASANSYVTNQMVGKGSNWRWNYGYYTGWINSNGLPQDDTGNAILYYTNDIPGRSYTYGSDDNVGTYYKGCFDDGFNRGWGERHFKNGDYLVGTWRGAWKEAFYSNDKKLFDGSYYSPSGIKYKCYGVATGETDGNFYLMYKVSFNANGGSGVPGTIEQNTYQQTLTISSTKPTRNGYTFLGWSKSKTATSASYSAGGTIKPTDHTTLYAVWSPNTYTVKYNANGGTGAPSNQTKYHGSNLSLTTSKPTKTGYTFVNWNTKTDGTGTSYASGGTYSANVSATLYAQWSLNSYSATFDANGGTFASNATRSKSVNYGATITSDGISTPTRQYHNFVGWSRSQTATSAGSLGNMNSTSGVTIYAVWAPNKYTITYDANGGTGAPDAQTKTALVDILLSSTVPTRTDYIFKGWGTYASAKTTNYHPGDTYTSNENITLYAIWVPDKYTVRYDANGGENAPGSQIKYYETDLTLSTQVPTREGYTFLGWASKEAFASGKKQKKILGSIYTYVNEYNADLSSVYATPEYQPGDIYSTDENITLYAVWQGNYFIHYDANGGKNAPASQTFSEGETIELSKSVPVYSTDILNPSDVMFCGWAESPDAEAATYQPGDLFSENRTVTLYAVWNSSTAETYTITFDANGGENAPEPQIKQQYRPLTLTDEVPTRDGYMFLFWSSKKSVMDISNSAALDTFNFARVHYCDWENDNNARKEITDDFLGYLSTSMISISFNNTFFKYYFGTGYFPGDIYSADASTTLYANWIALDDYYYIVEEYLMNTEGEYDLVSSQEFETNSINPTADYNIEDGFCLNSELSVLSLEEFFSNLKESNFDLYCDEDYGEPVLKVYIDRNKYNLTFDDGTNTETTEIYYGADVCRPANPVKPGYTFLGWDTEIPETMPAYDVIVTALWAVNEYKVIYFYEDILSGMGSIANTLDGLVYVSDTFGLNLYDTFVYGETVILRDKCEKEGYTVTDWELTPALENGKMPACDVLAESYSYINTYTVTWNYEDDSYEEEYEYGAEITEFIPPEKKGYTFSEWSPEIEDTMPAHDLEYIAQYEINNYIITYTIDDEFYDEKSYDYNADVTKLEIPKRHGYVFSGWNEEEPEKMPACDITLNGFWLPTISPYTVETYVMNVEGEYDMTSENKSDVTGVPVIAEYTISEGFTLNSEKSVLEGEVVADGSLVLKVYIDRNMHNISFNDGTNTTTDELYYGDEIVKPADPEKEGYTFEGWSEDGETVVEVEETVPDRDIEYIAVWSINQYSIIFEYGEVNDNAVYKTITEDFGTGIEEVADPEFEGYTFLGWDAEIPETMPAQNTAITALWAINEYKVTYKLDGVEYFATPYESAVDTFTYGSKVAVRPNAVKEGYTVSDWAFTPELVDGKMPSDNVVANATSTKNTYNLTVTYEMSDGKDELAPDAYSQAVEYGKDYSVASPEVTGYTPDAVAVEGTMGAGDVAVTVKYSPNAHTVTWNVDGEKTVDELVYGDEITKPEDPEKEGYTFEGWSEDGENVIDVEDTVPDRDIEYIAVFSINSYTITYNVDGVKYDEKSYEYNADVTKISVPEKQGYVFSGWDKEEPEKMPAENLVLNGSFSAATDTKYTVETYVMNLEGEYDKTSESFTGTTGKTATAEYTVSEGFTLNSEKSELTGVIAPDNSLVLKVYLDRNKHIISFNDGTETTSEELFYGEDIVKPEDPTKEGNDFLGWSEDGETVVDVEETVPDRDIEYIAVWSIKQYSIIFKYGEVNDNAVYKTIIEDYGTEIEEVADPEFEGYTFLGWDSQIPATMPSENLTITALWSVNEYKITYKLDGVEYFAMPYESAIDTFTYGSEVTVRPNAVKEGYTVSGWVFTPDLEDGKMPASDVIANATSSANKYTLTVNYVMNDGSDAPEAHTEQVTYGEGYSVETPAVTGYTPDTELVEGTMDSTEGKTVTVTYDINSYDVNITYEISDDKADAPEAYSQTVEYGMDYSVESPDVPGYTPDTAVVEGTMGAEDVNVTVTYTPNSHTVTWNVDGEKTVDELVYGDEITKPEDPEKEGYTFEGWSEDGETVVDIEETVPDRDIEYIAVWSINSYTITYNVDGEKYDEKTYEYNADIAKLTAPVKQGYVFSGWDSEEPEKMPAQNLVLNGTFSAATDTKYTVETYVMNLSGEYDKTSEEFTGITGEPATAEYTVLEGFSLNADKSELEGIIAADGSLVLKVYIDRNKHNISFNDGTETASEELYYGDDIVKPADPEKEGNEFLGWSEDGENVVDVEETVPDIDIEYIAVWSINSYTITFNYGEVNDNAEYKTITKEFGKEIEEVADPEFTGYTFLGWDSQIPATMPSENLTITALWSVNEYKITYKLDGVEYFATLYESAVDIFTYGSEVTVRPNAVKEGYTVSDWEFTPALENGKMPASDVTANATSAADIHTVTFTYGEVNGGAVYKEISAEYGMPVTAPENPEFSGFIFSGWDKNIPETIPAEDVTINAVWSQGTFTVTYKLDGEEYFAAPYESASDTVLYGEPVSVREKAVKEGYTVSDWEFTPALEDGKMPAGDVVANATSSVNSYTVTWIVNGSSTVDTYSFGAEIIRPEDPAMSGKVFKGWSGEIPATMPARNLVFVASFNAITHTATFVVPDKNGSYTDETGTYEVVKIVVFEEGQTAIAEPAVPEKDGFTGAWEDYTIGTTDIVIKAIYTIITTDNTGDIETDKTVEELGGGVVNITLNAYSDAQSILIDGENEPLDIILVVDQSGSMAYKMGKDENANVGQRRRDYLVNTATSFVNSVKQNAKETGADHRVSIVGFAMGNTSAQGYSKYENTEVLTTKNDSPVVYNKATSDVYRDSLMSVTDDYSHIMAAINNIDARGATAANLGFDMASKVLSENASDRKKVVIFLTDGEPTVTSDFDNGVANSAIINAKYLKAQGVTVYSIAISNKANPADETQDFNKFLNATSSNYPEASSVWRLSEGSKDNGYFVSVNDAEGLQKIFNNIYVRSVAKTLNFGAVTLYDTVRKEFIMTVPQEKAFRENAIEKYGITNSDITVDRRDDGTTCIEVRNLTPYPYYDSTNVMQGWKVDVSFDVSASESALNGGDYITNTDEAGVIVGGYTVKTFVSPEATVENNRCIVEFIIGNDVYEIREMDMGEEIIAPECSYAHWNIPEGTKVSGRVAKYYANYGEADRTITWHIGGETVTQNYATGQKIVPPEVNEGDRQFVRWSPNVEAYMGYIDLEYTAVFSNHIHHYRQSKSVGLCDAGRTVTYTCSCGESYTEKTAACEHRLETTVYETDTATITHIFCTNCPFSEDKLLTFKTANTGSNGYWVYHNSTVASFDLYNDVDGGEIHNLDENQYIYIRVPKSSLSQSCRNALEQGKSINIIHYLADGGTEKCPYAVEEDYIVVKCTSFSYYVFTADELDESVSNAAFDCLFDGHQFKYVYNNDATATKDGTETEVCEHCGATGETRTADGTKLNSEYKLPTSFKTQTAAYKTYVTVSVTLKDIPAGAKVYINGKEATASGNTYSADIGQVTATKEVKLEVKQGSTVLDSTTLKIEVNSSFFGKLISFFVNFLFNLFKWKKVTVSF